MALWDGHVIPTVTLTGTVVGRGTLAASSTPAADRQQTVAGENSAGRIIYGPDRVGGQIAAVLTNATYLYILAVWCYGECEAIDSVEMWDEPLPAGTVHSPHLGLASQSVDTWMAAAAAAQYQPRPYTDTLNNWCYSVFVIPASAANGFPTVTAKIRGRKVALTSGGTPTYTTNPAYCLADFIENTSYGMGMAVDWTSVAAVAAKCDEMIGTPAEKRRTIGLTMANVQDSTAWLKTLCAYAGCMFHQEANTLYLIPSSSAASEFTFDKTNIIEESLRMVKTGTRAVPTVMRVSYTDIRALPYRDGVATVYASGVTAGTTPRRESQVSMPGVNRHSQAYREAIERINLLTLADLLVEFETFDAALALQYGRVFTVTHPIGLAAKLFRCTRIDDLGFGRYRITGAEYDPAAYSDVVVDDPTYDDTPLPTPNDPPAVENVRAVEEIYQSDTGLWASRLRIAWDTPINFPFVRTYFIDIRATLPIGINSTDVPDSVAHSAVVPGTVLEYVTKPLSENRQYDIRVSIETVTGVLGAAGVFSILPIGKLAKPKDFKTLTGYEIGGEVRLTWSETAWDGGPIDLDWTTTELRYSATSESSWDNTTLLDRVAAPSIRYTTREVPPGTWKFWVRPRDSVRSEAKDGSGDSKTIGQLSDGTRTPTCNIIVTSDAGAFVADAHAYTTPTLYNMTAHVVSDGSTFWVTDWAQTWNALFTSTMNTYTYPLATYHTAGNSGLVTEVYDHASTLTGDWVATLNYENLQDASTILAGVFLDLNTAGGEATKTVTGATNATPIVMTVTGHGYQNSQEVLQAGVLGNTAANGRFLLTYIDANSYSLQDLCGNNVAGNGAWSAGGTQTASRWIWTPYAGGNAKGSGRYSRLRYSTKGTLKVNALGSVQVNVVARREPGGIVTTSATAPKIVSFVGEYNAAISASVTPQGVEPAAGVYDSIEVSQGRGINVGYVLKFTSANGHYVTCGNHATHNFGNGSNLPFSMECWYRADSFVSNAALVNRSTGLNAGEYRLMLTAAGNIAFHLIDNTAAGRIMVAGTTKLALGTWYHVAATYNGNGAGSGVKIYIDGVTDTTATTTGGAAFAFMRSTAAALEFGRWAPSTYADGRIDDVRLWNTERTQAQIVANKDDLIDPSVAPNNTTLVGYWKFDEGSGTTANDSTANVKHGTLTGTTGVPLYRPYNGMDVYRFDKTNVQEAGLVSWDFQGV